MGCWEKGLAEEEIAVHLCAAVSTTARPRRRQQAPAFGLAVRFAINDRLRTGTDKGNLTV